MTADEQAQLEWEALYTAALVDLQRARKERDAAQVDAAARLETCRAALSFWQRYVDRTGPSQSWALSVLQKLRDAVEPHPGLPLLTELATLRHIAQLAADMVETDVDTDAFETAYEALEQAVRGWREHSGR